MEAPRDVVATLAFIVIVLVLIALAFIFING